MPPRLGPSSVRLLLAALSLTAVLWALSCANTRGSIKDGWYTQNLRLEGKQGPTLLELRYRPGSPGADWESSSSPTADLAWYSSQQQATLYSDSSCGARYEDAPLSALLQHLLFGFTDVELNEPVERSLSARAALTREGSARLDGVPVDIAVSVTKNGPCVFDLVFIGAPGSLTEGQASYQNFITGMQVEYRP
ncbi:MAG: hypothetical protein CMP23_10120 [Rickettsiales bacterium]|nr:hypothetical protein [Rickettsiales bacterium]